jgi:hypothetical protein
MNRNAVRFWFVVLVVTAGAAAMLGGGAFLLVQRATGPRAVATVGDCTTTGSGRYRSVHCTGSWTEGGSLFEGGHIVVGAIQGAETTDIGKNLDVTVRGDTAYTRDVKLPLLLIGFGIVLCVALVNFIRVTARRRRA